MRKTVFLLLALAVVIGGLIVAAHQLDLSALIRQLHGG